MNVRRLAVGGPYCVTQLIFGRARQASGQLDTSAWITIVDSALGRLGRGLGQYVRRKTGFSRVRSKVFIYTSPESQTTKTTGKHAIDEGKKIHEIIGVINRCPVRGSISPPRGGLDGGGSFFAGGLEPAAHT